MECRQSAFVLPFIQLYAGSPSKLRPGRGGLHQEQAQVLVRVHRTGLEGAGQGKVLLRGNHQS